MTITIVGLGPGNPELITRAAERALREAKVLFLRTDRHPGVRELLGERAYESFDALYDTLDSFDVVYGAICERLVVAERQHGAIVYAVPGDPLLAEATVRRLLVASREGGPAVQTVAGLSFLEPVCHALELDPLAGGLQLLDALEPGAVEPARPALFAQVHGRRVASHLKLALLDLYPPSHEVALVSAAGIAGEERVLRLPLVELDRGDHADHLSTLFVPALALEANQRSWNGFRGIVHRLYAPGGCPWDREQTHASLKHHLLEEAYEVLQALDEDDPRALAEELGDLLLQIGLHTEIADEAGEFGYGDLFEAITSKLVRRHPHVFGDVTAGSAEEVMANWQRIKAQEKAEKARADEQEPESILAGVPRAMPSLAYAQAVQDRAAAVGFDWPRVDDVIEKLMEEVAELRRADTHAERLDEFGDVVFVLANLARWLKIDAEEAGRLAGQKFFRRFSGIERLSRQQGRQLDQMTLTEMDSLWDRVKLEERAAQA